jgi:hypothetical protein
MSGVSSGTIAVGTTAVQLDGNSNGWSHVHIRNNDSTKTLFIGNGNVTFGNGLSVDKMATIDFDVPPGVAFHMVTDSGTCSVSWLRIDH